MGGYLPPLAPRALEAARAYARIAPDAPHALHMPSHTFTRLGYWDESIDSFDTMGLKEGLLRGIYSYGFEKPSAIQQKGIKPITMGRNVETSVHLALPVSL